jgi:hypothetical protein
VGAREWLLLAVVVLVPLAIAAAVTLWSLEQARYRPKTKGTVRTSSGVSRRTRPDAKRQAGGNNDGGDTAVGGETRPDSAAAR